MPQFPSLEWLNAVREAANNDAQFTSQGTINCRVGIKAADQAFALNFEGFECASAETIPTHRLRDTDFYLDMSNSEWQSLLRNISDNHGADSAHTLNTLDLTMPDGCVKSNNALQRNAFYQYHLSLQAFFDASANVETTFT